MRTCIFVILLLVVALPVVSSADDQDLKYFPGTSYTNDPFELRVYPRDTIYLGRTYDLSYVMGSNHTFARWNDWKLGGLDCSPDDIYPIDYIQTNGEVNPKAVFLDPANGWKTGDYYQWDGCMVKYNLKSGDYDSIPHLNDNNYMFTVINPPQRDNSEERLRKWNELQAKAAQVENISVMKNTRGELVSVGSNKSVRGEMQDVQPKSTSGRNIRGGSQTQDINEPQIETRDETIYVTSTPNHTASNDKPHDSGIPWYFYVIGAIIVIAVLVFLFG